MQLQGMTIALRQRLPWEATDLGIALVREHARRIFAAWCLVTLPVWVLINGLGLAIDMPWVAMLAMWWLKPLFDRVPLYAISRPVFGQVPSVREIVRAQASWGLREVVPWLLWRRLHPGRLLLLPVDLLERASGDKRRERVTVLTKGDAGPSSQLIVLGSTVEWVLTTALVLSVLIFVPSEFLSDAAASVFQHLKDDPPLWAKLALNGCVWFGTSLVEPFMVGAGFGLYLNRRVQLEAWDVEHAFRRIAARLARSAQPLCLLLVLAGLALHAPAQAATAAPCQTTATRAADANDTSPADDSIACPSSDNDSRLTRTSLPALFGAHYRSDGSAFAARVKHANADLNRTVRDWYWVSHDEPAPQLQNHSGLQLWASDIGAVVARFGLWILAGVALAFVLYHHRTWVSWARDLKTLDEPAALGTQAREAPTGLPADVPAAVRALWQRGEQRAALALFYQAAVQRLADGLGTPLPPGATEGECLARSRQLGNRRFAGLFVRIVGCWQAAAYARRMPETTQLEGLLDEWVDPVRVIA